MFIENTTSVFITQSDSPARGYSVSLIDKLFADDIDELGKKLEETILDNDEDCDFLSFDISNAHPFLFKPGRFFGMCSYFFERTRTIGRDIKMSLIINTDQKSIFNTTINDLPFDIVIKNTNYTTSKPDISAVSIAPLSSIHFVLLDLILLVFGCLCIFAIFFGFHIYSNTMFGFALAFSGGILLYEITVAMKMSLNLYLKRIRQKDDSCD